MVVAAGLVLLLLQVGPFLGAPAVCENSGHVSGAFAGKLPAGVSLTNAQMVLSRERGLESWYLVSALVRGGPSEGETATWALPGFDGRSVDQVNTSRLAVPANQTADGLGFGMTLDPAGYGFGRWLQLDGANMSRDCVAALGVGLGPVGR